MTTSDLGPRRGLRRRAALALGLIGLAAASTWWALARPATGRGRLSIPLNTFNETGEVAFSPDGRTIATPGLRSIPPFHKPYPEGLIPEYWASQGLVELRDAATGARFASLGFDPIHGATSVRPILFSPDGSSLVAGDWCDACTQTSPVLKVWEVRSGRLRTTIKLPTGYGREAIFSPDGRMLLVNFDDTTAWPSRLRVLRWETSDWSPVEGMSIPCNDIYAAALASDGTFLAASHLGSNRLTFHEIPSGRERASLSPPRPANLIDPYPSLLFSPDGRTLAGWRRGGEEVHLWDLPSATLRASIRTAADGSTFPGDFPLAFSPDGRTLALGGSYVPREGALGRLAGDLSDYLGVAWRRPELVGRVTLVDAATGLRRSEIDGTLTRLAHLTFSPDGRTLVTDGVFPRPDPPSSASAKSIVIDSSSSALYTPHLDRRLIFRDLPAGP